MLVKFGAPSLEPGAQPDGAEPSPLKQDAKDHAVQTNLPSLALPAPSASQAPSSPREARRDKSEHASSATADSSSQTDGPTLSGGEGRGVRQDAAVQTEAAGELPLSRRSSWSSSEGAERMDSVATAGG